MSEIKTKVLSVWKGLDNLLLASVFVLLGLWVYSSRQTIERTMPDQVTQERRSVVKPPRNMPSSGRTVDGLRVSLENERMNSIARSMASAAWERVPACPAMDMREDGKSYEIYFSLPDGFDESNVHVSAHGSVLTLAMTSEDDGSLTVQRFRVPCSMEKGKSIETAISNNVLCVRIQPALGN